LKGYNLDITGALDLKSASVRHDLDFPDQCPKSVAGTLSKALSLRMERGLEPFTIMSCDNLPRNGHLAKTMVLGFVMATKSEALAKYVESRCKFPNTMV
jgi:mannitol-1-phosphate/altronate dehydrogenase